MKNKTVSSVIFMMLFSTSLMTANSSIAAPATSQMNSTHSTQMMTREMMRNMSKLMDQMNIMTRDMKRLMDKSGDMDQLRVREMSRVMEQLAEAMRNMSQQMSKGDMDKNMLREMEQHMNQIRNMIQTMEKNN